MNGIKAYALSKKYTADTADSLGSLKGAPAKIKSIEKSSDGYNVVTFEWEGTSGAKETGTMRVDDGISISQVLVDENNDMTIIRSDGSEISGGHINAKDGKTPVVEVGSTETVDYEEGAEVIGTPTEEGISLDFQIPRGEPGEADPSWNVI